MLALAAPAAALSPAAATLHQASRVQRTPTVSAVANGRRAALAAGLGLAVSAAKSASAVDVQPWAYSTLLEEIDAKHVTSALLTNDGKQVLTIDKSQGIDCDIVIISCTK